MFIVSPSTLRNPSALEMRTAPKRMLGRVTLIPRKGLSGRQFLRLIFEVQILRFLLPLIPFVVAMLIWPHLALPISQAPIPMLMVIGFVEMRVLSVKPDARDALISDADMARGLDAFRFNANQILNRIAAHRDLSEAEIMLVVEQSTLARIPPLTLVSIQEAQPKARVLDLDVEERAMIASTLFDADLTEKDLQLIALRENENLRTVTLDTRSVSAHARMAAMIAPKAQAG